MMIAQRTWPEHCAEEREEHLTARCHLDEALVAHEHARLEHVLEGAVPVLRRREKTNALFD